MTEFVYKDYLPANARVIVDYSKNERVGFSYPISWSYNRAVWKRAYPTIMSAWLVLHMAPLVLLFPFILGFFVLSAIFFPNSNVSTVTNYFDFYHTILPLVYMFAYTLGIPVIITWFLSLNKERMSAWLPKIGYFAAWALSGTKNKVFVAKDVIHNKVIIPSFSNVFLNYEGSKDFNRFLVKVEILEIPFFYKCRRLFLSFLSKKEQNDFVFRAVFYFRKRPVRGELSVEFV